MLKVLGCVAHEHDLRLVALSAMICVLGCLTTTSLLERVVRCPQGGGRPWLASAAVVFGSSVWSLHFVAMLAFTPADGMAYGIGLTTLSDVVAVVGSFAALLVWRAPIKRKLAIPCAGLVLGLSIATMHYVGVAALSFSGFLLLDRDYVAASVVVGVAFSAIAMARADDLGTVGRHLEVGAWLALAICGVHFTGMTAITLAPGVAVTTEGAILGTSTLAVAVGGVSVAILIASLAAVVVERHMSQRVVQELGRMRLMSNLAQEVLFIHSGGVVLEVSRITSRRCGALSSRDRVGKLPAVRS